MQDPQGRYFTDMPFQFFVNALFYLLLVSKVSLEDVHEGMLCAQRQYEGYMVREAEKAADIVR